MIVKSVELSNFRNYENLSLTLDEGTNILFGDNAQGKTNIIEAVYVSGTSKSHRSTREKEMIRFDAEDSHIKTIVEKGGGDFRIDIHLKKSKSRGIAINGIPIKRATDLFGILNLVLFSPEDLDIIKEGPAKRRRFIDMELCQLDKIYMYNIGKYNKILNQRNCLLKDMAYNEDLGSTLNVWDDQLVNYGTKVIEARDEFIKEISGLIRDIHRKITGGKEELFVEYEPAVSSGSFREELERSRDRDLKLRQTNIGPHRDDISFSLEGIDVRKYGSQGQQRTCALSLKLSEIETVRRVTGEKPVLLLDDVLSELDSSRQNLLLSCIEDIQTIITCTGLEEFVRNRFKIDKVFEVRQGKVEDYKGEVDINE